MGGALGQDRTQTAVLLAALLMGGGSAVETVGSRVFGAEKATDAQVGTVEVRQASLETRVEGIDRRLEMIEERILDVERREHDEEPEPVVSPYTLSEPDETYSEYEDY